MMSESALASLRATGLWKPNRMLPLHQITAANAYLHSRPVYADAHVPQTARNRGGELVPRSEAAGSECVCVHTDDAILAPYLLETALGCTDIAALYLDREPPVLYSANAFWTRAGSVPPRWDIQEFHRDMDDERFLVMFVYLTDVLLEEHGPHELKGPDGQARTIVGFAGTFFFADTSYEHRGLKPTRGERGIAWFRWGVSARPPANEWDKIEPIGRERLGTRYPSDPRLQESIRLLVF